MKNVTIIQRVLPHYRLPFFRKMHGNLRENDINMKLIYGQEYPGTVPQTVPLDEPWAFKVRNTYLKIPGIELVWQPCLKNIKGSDLIVIEQANRLVVNYLLLSGLAAKKSKIAFWGHGKNLQLANTNGMREPFKRFFVNKADWWFAYTEMSAKFVEERGFPRNKITIVNNSIDTVSLATACNDITDEDISRVKKEIGINSANVCVYCGGMYGEKKLHFLIESCLLLREMIPDFHMIFIGDGPLQQLISDACASHSWMHYVGPKYGNERVPYLKTAKAILMPGPVGLVVIDSFMACVPLITTHIPFHGPEIYYLENNKNGVITNYEVNAYASEVACYLRSPEKQDQLKKGCAESSRFYSMDNMVNNFTSGVTACLLLPD